MEGLFSRLIFERVEVDAGEFELPILYFREDSFVLFFTADEQRLRDALPSPEMHPVTVGRGRGVVAVAAFNYVETTIGPYGELAVAVPVVYGRRPLPLLPLLREANCKGFGMMVLQLPVTTQMARDAGRSVWGYPKFVADMDFLVTPERLKCELREGERLILRVEVRRGGILRRDNRPLVTYSVKDGNLVKTVIPQRAVYMTDIFPDGFVELGEHPVAESIAKLGLSSRPFASRVYLYRPAVLPAGEVVARGVSDIYRYQGEDREGRLTVRYRES